MGWMEELDWESVRTLVATAEAGSMSGAARVLGTTQPTVSRRISLLEEHVGGPLLVRHGRGVRPTPRGETLLVAARGVEEAMRRVERIVRGVRGEPTGPVRVAATEVVGVHVLTPALPALWARAPGIDLELVLDNRPADLMRGEADLAVRLFRPTQLDLVTREVARVEVGLYASQAYLATHGTPASSSDLLQGHRLAGFDPQGELAGAIATFAPELQDVPFALASDALEVHWMAARAGVAIAFLQAPLAARAPELVPVLGHLPRPSLSFWLTMHPDVRAGAAVEAVRGWLEEVLVEYAQERVCLG